VYLIQIFNKYFYTFLFFPFTVVTRLSVRNSIWPVKIWPQQSP